ncbi:cytochrome P450 6a9-like [Musca vetustissima]|uniref:cytochrome P450 6a9-like n=1 Tax=Musca vetustissima TaxID=27455 RepID=UPI002AB7B5ED|nr:cytochrome P450 6a9-like [Musca vetustissima]
MAISSFLIAIILLLIGYIVHRVREHYNYWKRRDIAHDPPHWLLGNFIGVTANLSLGECVRKVYDKYKNTGPFFGFYWFAQKAVVVNDPDLIKRILIKDFWKFSSRGMYHNTEDDPLSGQLFNLDGGKWKNMRVQLTPAFTSGKMKLMFPLMEKIGQEVAKVFGEELEHSDVIEVWDVMARYTSDVIGSCAFGIETNSLKNSKSEFRQMGRKAMVEVRGGTLGAAFRLNFPQLARRLHLKETVPEVEKYFLELIGSTVKYREENNIRRNDFMDMLIDLKNKPMVKSESGEELKQLNFGEIAAQAFLYLLAGYETSASTLAFTLYELACHEDIQERVRSEIMEVLDKHGQQLTYEGMKECVYLEQVINETLRLHSIAPFLNRVAQEDYPIPDQPKFIIRKGMTVIIPIEGIQHDERYFPQPMEFNPDNFSAERMAQRDSILHIPFGEGPRNCIGIRFARMQVIIGLVLILKNFKFSISDETPRPMEYSKQGIILVPGAKGIPLKVKRV